MTHHDDAARSAYWSQQMDAAADFMDQAAECALEECGEPMVSLRQAVVEAGVEVTFSDRRYSTGHKRIYYLRQGLVPGVVQAAREMNQRGWRMHIEDGYRTLDMQTNVGRQPAVFDRILESTRRELGGKLPTPEFFLKRYRVLTALYPKVGTHTSGSAIDISVFDLKTGQEIDRGAPYLEMSELTPMDSPFVSDEAKANRQQITQIMARGGLLAYPFEFWHYNGGDTYETLLLQNGPAKYGPINWSPGEERIVPVADPMAPLNTPEDMQRLIEEALTRAATKS